MEVWLIVNSPLSHSPVADVFFSSVMYVDTEPWSLVLCCHISYPIKISSTFICICLCAAVEAVYVVVSNHGFYFHCVSVSFIYIFKQQWPSLNIIVQKSEIPASIT